MENRDYIIIGAGLAGLCAAITLAQGKKHVILVSQMPSERAQSVMAEGGMNGALDTKGENDSITDHFNDTMKAGVYLADSRAVRNLTMEAPALIHWLHSLGVEYNMDDKKLDVRFFGGQKKRRTAYAGNCTGKQIMTGLIREVRKYEADGYVQRLSHHELEHFIVENEVCLGCIVRDLYHDSMEVLLGQVIVAAGGMNGLFGKTTGSVLNTGRAAAKALMCGAKIANAEMIQYHPTTCSMNGKRALISEAIRGEGGRLFTYVDGQKYYFMEERYPELKNLMPRVVVSREIWSVCREHGTSHVYLDVTHLSEEIFRKKLPEFVEMLSEYLDLDPRKDYLEVYPGIHYFMGGLYVDADHRTTLKGMYAAGECACQYHGANRLGGNSLLGAAYGGIRAAESAMRSEEEAAGYDRSAAAKVFSDYREHLERIKGRSGRIEVRSMRKMLAEVLNRDLGIVREEKELKRALEEIEQMLIRSQTGYDESVDVFENEELQAVLWLAKALVMSAMARKESRGAHTRSDYPETKEEFRRTTVVEWCGNELRVKFESTEP